MEPKCSITGLRKFIVVDFISWLFGAFPRFAKWLFRDGFRVAEFFNVWFLLGFGLALLAGENELLDIRIYKYFNAYPRLYPWLGMIFISFLQLYLMIKSTIEARQLSGVLLSGSSVVWFIIAATFGFNYPPVSSALPVYLGIAFMTGMAGYGLLNVSKEIDLLSSVLHLKVNPDGEK